MTAIRKLQEAYDARLPDDSGAREWLTAQVSQLLKGNDADGMPFFTQRFQIPAVRGFCDRLYENLSDIDAWPESFVIQCLLAVGRGDHEMAAAIYENHLRAGINEFAEQCIQESAA
ncbi:hypothetical protein N7403_31755 [Pseudomonas nitroreducens]|uniref:hypothetical protein n=1 Tax=Pseudomonas nitroreducens TaxID=46680 RepID=UPI00244CE5AB|nr:hypothetical protein [Pseudomonas nitroreducens]MDG9858449.1 hypothetical protein [Pseudomonas nitroreducens]